MNRKEDKIQNLLIGFAIFVLSLWTSKTEMTQLVLMDFSYPTVSIPYFMEIFEGHARGPHGQLSEANKHISSFLIQSISRIFDLSPVTSWELYRLLLIFGTNLLVFFVFKKRFHSYYGFIAVFVMSFTPILLHRVFSRDQLSNRVDMLLTFIFFLWLQNENRIRDYLKLLFVVILFTLNRPIAVFLPIVAGIYLAPKFFRKESGRIKLDTKGFTRVSAAFFGILLIALVTQTAAKTFGTRVSWGTNDIGSVLSKHRKSDSYWAFDIWKWRRQEDWKLIRQYFFGSEKKEQDPTTRNSFALGNFSDYKFGPEHGPFGSYKGVPIEPISKRTPAQNPREWARIADNRAFWIRDNTFYPTGISCVFYLLALFPLFYLSLKTTSQQSFRYCLATLGGGSVNSFPGRMLVRA